MDLGGDDNFQQEKGNEDLMSHHSPNVSSDWRYGGSNLENASMGTIPAGNPTSVCKGGLTESSSCSSAPVMDSLCPTNWDHPNNTQNLNFSDINLQNRASSTSNPMGIRKGAPGHLSIDSIERTLDMGWNPPKSMVKGGMVLPTGPGMLPQSFSQLQADSGFIKRAARFSCFDGGNFGDMMNHFSIPEPITHARGALVMQRPQGVFAGNKLNSVSGGQFHKNEMNMAEASKDVSLSVELGATGGSPLKNERKRESFLQLHDEARQGAGVSGNESNEAECSGSGHGGGQEEPSLLEGTGREPSFSKAFGLKKRKTSQDTEPDRVKEVSQTPGETTKDGIEIQHKGDQTPTSTTNKPGGKHSKQGSQDLDSPKGEYIHVRARRGQATNSHSLAERVRRERISERMKLLQDLVPGCSKVTGKAVMLDEIINYVQSLQRQVEFLSMKLATVNPHLDFNLERLLAKDILQPRAGPSPTLGHSSDMTMPFPSLRRSQPGLIHSVFPGLSSTSDGFQRSINIQLAALRGGYKEPCQVPNEWIEGELHNVVQLLNSSASLDCQDLNGMAP